MTEKRQATNILARLSGCFPLPLGGPEPEPASALVGAGSTSFSRYLVVLLGALLLGAGAVAGVNALVDPLWFFPHAHPLNRVQVGFDERAQKTNRLRAHRGQFDAVLFGSSRSTYLDQHDFAPWSLFNHAVNAMWPQEYRPYLDHFTEVNGRTPGLVVLGVDFFGSHDGVVGKWQPPETYLRQAGDPRYVLGSLLNLELLRRSLVTAARSAGLVAPLEQLDYYDRRNVRHSRQVMDETFRASEVLDDLEVFRARVYTDYDYNERLPELWRGLRAAYPNTRFLVFTTPIAAPMFALLVREGRLGDYERWIGDLTAAFGEVWDFMGLNSVTTDLSRYRDAQHFDPGIGRLIADRLLGRPVPAPHGDFGRLVTRETLAAHLGFVRRQLPCLDPDPIRTARERLEARRVGTTRASGPSSLDGTEGSRPSAPAGSPCVVELAGVPPRR
jgi:hypothetical protein